MPHSFTTRLLASWPVESTSAGKFWSGLALPSTSSPVWPAPKPKINRPKFLGHIGAAAAAAGGLCGIPAAVAASTVANALSAKTSVMAANQHDGVTQACSLRGSRDAGQHPGDSTLQPICRRESLFDKSALLAAALQAGRCFLCLRRTVFHSMNAWQRPHLARSNLPDVTMEVLWTQIRALCSSAHARTDSWMYRQWRAGFPCHRAQSATLLKLEYSLPSGSGSSCGAFENAMFRRS